MAIAVKLDELLHERRMTLTELAERIDITVANPVTFLNSSRSPSLAPNNFAKLPSKGIHQDRDYSRRCYERNPAGERRPRGFACPHLCSTRDLSAARDWARRDDRARGGQPPGDQPGCHPEPARRRVGAGVRRPQIPPQDASATNVRVRVEVHLDVGLRPAAMVCQPIASDLCRGFLQHRRWRHPYAARDPMGLRLPSLRKAVRRALALTKGVVAWGRWKSRAGGCPS